MIALALALSFLGCLAFARDWLWRRERLSADLREPLAALGAKVETLGALSAKLEGVASDVETLKFASAMKPRDRKAVGA